MTQKIFSRPAIVEALCEIHFQIPEKWDSTYGSQFYNNIQSEFTAFEPVTDLMMAIEHTSEGIRQSVIPQTQKIRYRHSNQKLILQLSENIFTVNNIKDYAGWQDLKQNIISYWKKLNSVIGPSKISRIGLRYINKIPRNEANQLPSEWLKENDYIANCVLKSTNGFLSRIETKFNESQRGIITLASEEGSIIYDIDCICDNLISTQNVEGELEKLHAKIDEIFFNSITSKLENYMNGN